MAILAKGSTGGADFTPAPEGTFSAVCVDIVDLGLVERTYEGKTTHDHMIRLVWEIDEMNEEGRPFLVFARYKVSLHEKASLRKILDTWRGVKFSDSDLTEGFDVEKLIGKPCLVTIVHNEGKQGGVFANVQAVTRLPKGMAPLEPSGGYVRRCERDDWVEPNHVAPSAPVAPAAPAPGRGAAPRGNAALTAAPPRTVLEVDEQDLPF